MEGWVWGFGGCFGLGRVCFGLARGMLGLGVVVLGDVFLGGWGGAGWVCRLVGCFFGAGGLRSGMGDWDIGLEGGIWVGIDRFWALAGSLDPVTKN